MSTSAITVDVGDTFPLVNVVRYDGRETTLTEERMGKCGIYLFFYLEYIYMDWLIEGVSRFVESHQEKPVYLAATALLGSRTKFMTRVRNINKKNYLYWASDADVPLGGRHVGDSYFAKIFFLDSDGSVRKHLLIHCPFLKGDIAEFYCNCLYDMIQDQLAESQQINGEQKDQLAESQLINGDLRDELAESQRINGELQDELAESQRRFTEEVDESERKLVEVNRLNDVIIKEKVELNQQVTSLRAKLNQVQVKLNEVQEELNGLRNRRRIPFRSFGNSILQALHTVETLQNLLN